MLTITQAFNHWPAQFSNAPRRSSVLRPTARQISPLPARPAPQGIAPHGALEYSSPPAPPSVIISGAIPRPYSASAWSSLARYTGDGFPSYPRPKTPNRVQTAHLGPVRHRFQFGNKPTNSMPNPAASASSTTAPRGCASCSSWLGLAGHRNLRKAVGQFSVISCQFQLGTPATLGPAANFINSWTFVPFA